MHNNYKKGIKIFLLILITFCLTLVIEAFVYAVRTYNPSYTDESVLEYYLNGKEKNYCFSNLDVYYKTKVNPQLSLFENMYNVEKKLEADQFIAIGGNPEHYRTDYKTLHDGFMELKTKFNWNIFNEQSNFNGRIRQCFSNKSIQNYNEGSSKILVDDTKEEKSILILCNSLYSKSNHNKYYFMIQMYLQNESDFIYINNFGRGKVVENYLNREKLKSLAWNKFDEIFQNCK